MIAFEKPAVPLMQKHLELVLLIGSAWCGWVGSFLSDVNITVQHQLLALSGCDNLERAAHSLCSAYFE